jgi:hypothetical protein
MMRISRRRRVHLRPRLNVSALLAAQVVAQTVVRLKATEESFFDNADWP